MALRAFIYLRAYGLRLATVIYGVCTQGNGKRCLHYIIQIMQSLAEALRTPGTALHNLALCKAREWRASWALCGVSNGRKSAGKCIKIESMVL